MRCMFTRQTKAFKRLAANIKQKFPRLPIILLADSLYASEPVMGLCREYGWDYIIRFKDGSIPSVASEYKDIPEKGRAGNAEYVNGIDYNGNKVNLLKYKERQVHYQEDRRCRNGKPKTRKPEIREVDFQWITNIEITDKNAGKLAAAGRIRWKVENEGFNRQKNWQGDITHACSWNDRAQKNHYLMMQISDAMKQLYEHCYLKRKGISKKQKDISSDLLKSFDQQPTREDISLEMEMHSATIH